MKGNFAQRPVSFRSGEQSRAAAPCPTSPGAPITLNIPAVCASINSPAIFLYNLKQNSTSAPVAAGHNEYIPSDFSSKRKSIHILSTLLRHLYE